MNEVAAANEPAAFPLKGAAFIVAAVLVAFANFLASLDLAIANVSIPSIAAGLGVSPREGAWTITSYAIAEAISVPLTGWLAARFGPARTLVFCMVGFGIASALCGTATSIQGLVIFRVFQGLSGGPMIPVSQTLLVGLFPKGKAGSAMGIWAMTAVMGPIFGPIVGGQMCDHFTWHWIFLINVPLAAIAAILTWRLMEKRDPPPQHRRVDIVGLLLMIVWISAIQFMLDRGHELDWLGSPIIVTLLVVATIGFIAFLIWELTDPGPIVDMRVFRHFGFTICVVVICFGFGAFFASAILQPLWLQTNMDYTPAWAGYATAPTGMAVFMMAPMVAWLTNRIDPRILISVGLFGFAGSFLWRASFASNVTFEMIVVSQFISGICMASFFAPTMSIAMGGLKPEELAAGAGMLAFTRTTVIGFGTALTTSGWQDAAVQSRVGLIDHIPDTNAFAQMKAMGLPPDQALRYLDGLVQNQAVMLATNRFYFWFAVAMAIGSALIWLAPRSGNRGGVPAGH